MRIIFLERQVIRSSKKFTVELISLIQNHFRNKLAGAKTRITLVVVIWKKHSEENWWRMQEKSIPSVLETKWATASLFLYHRQHGGSPKAEMTLWWLETRQDHFLPVLGVSSIPVTSFFWNSGPPPPIYTITMKWQREAAPLPEDRKEEPPSQAGEVLWTVTPSCNYAVELCHPTDSHT